MTVSVETIDGNVEPIALFAFNDKVRQSGGNLIAAEAAKAT